MTHRVVGVVLGSAGIFLVLRPLTTLALMVGVVVVGAIGAGIAILAGWVPGIPRVKTLQLPSALRRGVGFALIALGVVAGVWVEHTYTALAYAPAVVLVGVGLAILVGHALSADYTLRLGHPLIWGPSAVLAGFSVWRFPDVLAMAVAFGFGVAVVLMGLRVAGLFRLRRVPRARFVATVVVLPVSIGMVIASGALGSHPNVDGFYTRLNDQVNLAQEGGLLAVEDYPAPLGAEAKRMVYSTTRQGYDAPQLASGVVYSPRGVSSPPVIAWAHGTTGQAMGCAPSILGEESGGMMVLDSLLRAGWAVVATDYQGLTTPAGHPYLIGDNQARSLIDALKAADQTGLELGSEAVVWGYSQGGHAALWAGVSWQDRPPPQELEGVVAFAPAADLSGVVNHWAGSKFANPLSAYVLSAYGDEYPEINAKDYIRPGATLTAKAYSEHCLADPGTALSLTASLLHEGSLWKTPPTDGPLHARLEENTPTGEITVPVAVFQGLADTTIPAKVQGSYVDARCDRGWQVDYQTFEGVGHNTLVEPDSKAIESAISWTATAFSGGELPNRC